MTREELLKSPDYWTGKLQLELYRQIEDFMKKNEMNKTQLAEHLGCSKGYVSQLLNGDFDHKLSKFFELTLAIHKIPEITFSDVDDYIQSDKGNFKQRFTISVNNTVAYQSADISKENESVKEAA
jgi:transcriptional regulator with XRE-family HTH domain